MNNFIWCLNWTEYVRSSEFNLLRSQSRQNMIYVYFKHNYAFSNTKTNMTNYYKFLSLAFITLMIRNENENIIGLTFLYLPKFTYTRVYYKNTLNFKHYCCMTKKFNSVNEFLSHAEKKLWACTRKCNNNTNKF